MAAHIVDEEPAKTLHERLLVLDTHLDTPLLLSRPGWDIMERHDADDISQVDYPRMQEGGLDGGFFAIFTPQGPRTAEGYAAARDSALRRAVEIREMVARQRNEFELAFTPDDATRIKSAGKRIVYQSIENAHPLGDDLTLLRTFYDLGVRMAGIVHVLNNDFGDSSTDPKGPEWNGLSELGRDFVDEANRLGIVLDASHASDAALDQMSERSRTPIILSHSGCTAVFSHRRNVDDERLRKLAAGGGVIQINSLSGYMVAVAAHQERDAASRALSAKYGRPAQMQPDQVRAMMAERRALAEKYPFERATIEDFMAHVLHALAVVGPDHVGIGADWDGGGGVVGMDDVSALPRITERLLAAGLGEQDIAKIWSGNALRLLRTAQAHRTAS